MHRVPLKVFLLIAALLGGPDEARADFAIGVNFTGNNLADAANLNGFGFAPPDTDGFVGNKQYVQFTNGQFTVYDKADGSLAAAKISDTTFWNNAGAPSALVNQGLTDTRVVFDPQSQRWYAAEITLGNSSGLGNSVLLAVSNDADATHGFQATSFTAAPTTRFGDFTQFGLNADGVYVSLNNFRANGSFANESLFAVPKTSLLAAIPSTTGMTTFSAISANTVGFTPQPAIDFGPSNGHETLLAVSNTSASQLVHTNIAISTANGPFTNAGSTAINVAAMTAPGMAHQPDGTQQLDNGDTRFSGAVMKVGNLLYAVNSTEVAGHTAITWYVINEATNAVKQGTISNANYDYFYPSIAANANGDVVIGFSRSGLAADASGPGFISAFADVGSTDANGNLTFGNPFLLKGGQDNYHLFTGPGERWGDYSATSVDPTNPNAFWTTQEFAGTNNNWETQVTEIIITPTLVPEPTSIVLCVVGLAGMAIVRRRRSKLDRP